jgi:hypothetical protein
VENRATQRVSIEWDQSTVEAVVGSVLRKSDVLWLPDRMEPEWPILLNGVEFQEDELVELVGNETACDICEKLCGACDDDAWVLSHVWVPSMLGHGDAMCRRCLITNREAAAIGQTGCGGEMSTRPTPVDWIKLLLDLCGSTENSTDRTLTISQDDATRDWIVRVGYSRYVAASLREALEAAGRDTRDGH